MAVCFLHQGNREITRNVTSYLALAAIQNIQLMSLHTSSLISSVLKGEAEMANFNDNKNNSNNDN